MSNLLALHTIFLGGNFHAGRYVAKIPAAYVMVAGIGSPMCPDKIDSKIAK